MEILLFGQNVKHLREADGLKVADMQAAIGFPRSTWSGYELGSSFPNFKDLMKISDYFGILESHLLHVEVEQSDLRKLFAAYSYIRDVNEIDGNTPRSKSFSEWFKTNIEASPLDVSRRSVTESVTKPVTKGGKSPGKRYIIYSDPTHKAGQYLHEPAASYHVGASASTEDRLEAVEATLAALAQILVPFAPKK